MSKKMKYPTCSTKGWCTNHILSLFPQQNNLYYRKQQKIRLCPKLNKSTKTFQKLMPVVHEDGKFYTPCFVLQDDKKFYFDNDERVKRKHLLKLEQANSIDQSIVIALLMVFPDLQKEWMIPKHARKYNYCAVCRSDYVDYLDHIGSESHKKAIKSNKFNTYIMELETQFKSKVEQIKFIKQQPLIALINEQSTQFDERGLPRKKVKLE